MADPYELIDIINPNNQILNQATKAAAHEQGLLHRIIIAELIDSRGRYTLVKQAADRQDPGQYVSPVGGHIRAGESEIEALIRESQEEIGIIPNKYKRVGQAIYNREVIDRQENHLFIVYEIYSNTAPILNHESVSFRRFTPVEIKQLMITQPRIFGAAYHFVWNNFYEI